MRFVKEGLEGIGVVGVASVAAFLAAAAPVIAAVAPLLKQIGANKDKKDIENLEKETIDSGGDLSIPKGDIADGEPGSGKKPASKKDTEGSFLDDIPTPVKLIGGAALLYGLGKVTKIIK